MIAYLMKGCDDMEIPVKETAEAVKSIVEAIPIYQDLAQPAVKELGQGLQTVAKTVNIALAPLSALIWGFDKIKAYIEPALEERFTRKQVPPERICTPDPTVAGPALEALRFSGHKESLRDLYANLLSTAMDSAVANTAHPSFVEIIRQLTPDEAKIITVLNYNSYVPLVHLCRSDPSAPGEVLVSRNLSLIGIQAGCQYPEFVPSYLDNLNRLGLIEISDQRFLTTEGVYDDLENYTYIEDLKKKLIEQSLSPTLRRVYFCRTDFGSQFCRACL
jgi:hypothetical protein